MRLIYGVMHIEERVLKELDSNHFTFAGQKQISCAVRQSLNHLI